LVRAEHGHDPHGHSILVLFREGGDDTKAVALDSVVATPDTSPRSMTWPWRGFSPSACAGPMNANASAAARVVWRIVIVVSSYPGIYPV
jgi:hypothetical protein